MNQPNINEVIAEAKKFRLALERCKDEDIPFIIKGFPVMNCKLSSLLFIYHALKKWPSMTIYGVCGSATDLDGNDTISHYWLEYQETAIDLTADQYNILEDAELNKKIIKYRPFKSVSTGRIGSMLNYKLFKIDRRDTYTHELPELAKDFLWELQISYERIENIALSPAKSKENIQ